MASDMLAVGIGVGTGVGMVSVAGFVGVLAFLFCRRAPTTTAADDDKNSRLAAPKMMGVIPHASVDSGEHSSTGSAAVGEDNTACAPHAKETHIVVTV